MKKIYLQNSRTLEILFGIVVLGFIFYWSAYLSVSSVAPSSIPVHHDDYSLYAAGGEAFRLSWIRPLSYFYMHVLSTAGPDWFAWSVRLLCVWYVLLVWLLLQDVVDKRFNNYFILPFGVAIFSSPIIVDNARYMGVVTQLLSGCLGLWSAWMVLTAARKSDQTKTALRWLALSGLLIILSTLAKEGYVLLYVFSLLYAIYRWKPSLKLFLPMGLGFAFISGSFILGAKVLAGSAFLGVNDPSSTYYVNLNPLSILQTIGVYLTGGNHPAMRVHGAVIVVLNIVIVGLLVSRLRLRRQFHPSVYLMACAFIVMAPYTVLPNHVYPYYEILWIPFFIACFLSLISDFKSRSDRPSSFVGARLPIAIMVGLALIFSVADFKGRQGIARWYDSMALENQKLLREIQSKSKKIQKVKSACIKGASMFSPWYLHDAGYLKYVMEIDATWFVMSREGEPTHSGLKAGADTSRNRTVLITEYGDAPSDCVRIEFSK